MKAVWCLLVLTPCAAQQFKLSFEQRGRYEDRTGNAFGKDVDVATGLYRTRLGLTYAPVEWLKLSGMAQDARAPWYGPGAPNTLRDGADLHEAYFELFPSHKRGFGMTAGRMMLNYGEGRVIGTPQWSNLARTYDHARIYWRFAKARVEALLVSPVKIRIGEFNRPALGDRVWGTYNVFPDFYKGQLLEAYVLRRDQNAPTRVRVYTGGFRLAGPVASGVKYSLEGVLQRAAGAWFSGLSRRWTVAHRALDVGAEYKHASAAYDQISPANHDKFGHEDLFGWRNLHNVRSLTSFGLTRNVAIHFMYDSYWLADPKEGIYNSSGRQIARSATGSAGRHVGQETDLFGTYKRGHFTLGAGYGHFFSGQFIRQTTPGVGPTYLYLFHTFSM